MAGAIHRLGRPTFVEKHAKDWNMSFATTGGRKKSFTCRKVLGGQGHSNQQGCTCRLWLQLARGPSPRAGGNRSIARRAAGLTDSRGAGGRLLAEGADHFPELLPKPEGLTGLFVARPVPFGVTDRPVERTFCGNKWACLCLRICVQWKPKGKLAFFQGLIPHSFQPSFFSKTSCFPRVLGGFLERRMPGQKISQPSLGCCRFPSKKLNFLLVKRKYEGNPRS